jgi:hypothetical protein
MIALALPRTRCFSARNWQILLTKQLECGPLIGVYMALTFFGRSRQQGPFSKADFIGTG